MVTRLDNSVYNYGMIKKVVDTLKDKTQNFLFSKECHNSSKVFCKFKIRELNCDFTQNGSCS